MWLISCANPERSTKGSLLTLGPNLIFQNTICSLGYECVHVEIYKVDVSFPTFCNRHFHFICFQLQTLAHSTPMNKNNFYSTKTKI